MVRMYVSGPCIRRKWPENKATAMNCSNGCELVVHFRKTPMHGLTAVWKRCRDGALPICWHFAFMHHPNLVRIVLAMPSLHLFTFLMFLFSCYKIIILTPLWSSVVPWQTMFSTALTWPLSGAKCRKSSDVGNKIKVSQKFKTQVD